MRKDILRIVPALITLALGGCAHALPPPNSVQARFDPRVRAVQLTISDREPTMQAELARADGVLVQAGSMTLVSKPHIYYNVGGGCGFGPTVTAALPPGGLPATCITEESDQYVASVSIPAPEDYARRWIEYRVKLRVGNRWLAVAAPPPAAAVDHAVIDRMSIAAHSGRIRTAEIEVPTEREAAD
jgi:hypothetical protein